MRTVFNSICPSRGVIGCLLWIHTEDVGDEDRYAAFVEVFWQMVVAGMASTVQAQISKAPDVPKQPTM